MTASTEISGRHVRESTVMDRKVGIRIGVIRDFFGSPVVRTAFPLQGAWVGSLVGELGSHMPCGTAKGGKKTGVIRAGIFRYWVARIMEQKSTQESNRRTIVPQRILFNIEVFFLELIFGYDDC